MAIHEWVSIALLCVLTIFNVGRWAQQRQAKEKDVADDAADVSSALASYRRDHKGEHENIWREIERQRKQYHDVRVPWEQQVSEKLARLDEHERSQDSQLTQLWARDDRRRSPRE